MFVAFFDEAGVGVACNEFHSHEEKRQMQDMLCAFGVGREFLSGFAGFGMGRY
jgi:hypothetical protein